MCHCAHSPQGPMDMVDWALEGGGSEWWVVESMDFGLKPFFSCLLSECSWIYDRRSLQFKKMKMTDYIT